MLESIFVGNRQQTQFNCKTLLKKASFLQSQACKESFEFRESSQSTITPTQSMKEFCFTGSRSRFKGTACFSAPTEAPTCSFPTPRLSLPLRARVFSLSQHAKATQIRRVRVHFQGLANPSSSQTAWWLNAGAVMKQNKNALLRSEFGEQCGEYWSLPSRGWREPEIKKGDREAIDIDKENMQESTWRHGI